MSHLIFDCEYCGEGKMVEAVFSQNIRSGRSNLIVDGLRHCKCNACDTIITMPFQFESNAAVIAAAEKKASCYISVAMLKQFREKYSLSQKDAGRLIGAGDGAFGKYETGAKLSAPTAKLVRIALAVPEAMELLALEEGFELAYARKDSNADAPHADEGDILMAKAWKTGKFSSVYLSPQRHPDVCENDIEFFKSPTVINSAWHKPMMVA